MIKAHRSIIPVLLVLTAIYCGLGTAHACSIPVSAYPTVIAKGGTTSTITAHVAGSPSPSHTIQFTVSGPAGGSVSSPHETDSNGNAIATYTSGLNVGTATITATDLDQAGPPTGQCSITVYTINCIKIEATNDVDIYWPNPTDGEGTTSNVIWKANQSTFETNGTIVETCTRKAVADIFQPTTQHYILTFTLDRYPVCQTNQTPTTYFAEGDPNSDTGWAPTFSVADQSSITCNLIYSAALTFKVGNVTVDTQTIGAISEYDIYDTYKCDQTDFTREHLYNATKWGSSSTNLTYYGADSIPWKVHGGLQTAGFEYTYRANPWDLLTLKGDCDSHANLMKSALAVLGVSATTAQMKPSSPTTRTYCGIPEHYNYSSYEEKFFKYDSTTGTTNH